jgi:hypothetical protein
MRAVRNTGTDSSRNLVKKKYEKTIVTIQKSIWIERISGETIKKYTI